MEREGIDHLHVFILCNQFHSDIVFYSFLGEKKLGFLLDFTCDGGLELIIYYLLLLFSIGEIWWVFIYLFINIIIGVLNAAVG